MSDTPSSWFSSPRRFPLDENGKVDLSKKSTPTESESRPSNYLITDPVRGKYLVSVDWHNRLNSCQEVLLQDGGSVFIADSLVDGQNMSLHDHNHNIFRLDKGGNVIWQIQREEQGKIRWDLIMAEVAKGDKGNPETIRKSRRPFTTLSPIFVKQGSYKEGNPLLEEHKSNTWRNGFALIVRASSAVYELDIETGIATNITESGGREW